MSTLKDKQNELISGVTDRAKGVSVIAIIMTSMLALSFIFYMFFTASFGGTINVADLIMIALISVMMSPIWFAEGQKYGSKNQAYIDTRQKYNDRADSIVDNHLIGKLEEFCQHDFASQKEKFIQRRLGSVGLDVVHLDVARNCTNFVTSKKLATVGKTTQLNPVQIRVLRSLIFKKCPVQQVQTSTIMCGVTTSEVGKIRDTSDRNKYISLFGIVARAICTMVAMSFIYLQFSGGITLASVARTLILMSAIVTTACTSFAYGEKNIIKSKATFYAQLIDFTDRFFEWVQSYPAEANKAESHPHFTEAHKPTHPHIHESSSSTNEPTPTEAQQAN